jgi:hypothetical protein
MWTPPTTIPPPVASPGAAVGTAGLVGTGFPGTGVSTVTIWLRSQLASRVANSISAKTEINVFFMVSPPRSIFSSQQTAQPGSKYYSQGRRKDGRATGKAQAYGFMHKLFFYSLIWPSFISGNLGAI